MLKRRWRHLLALLLLIVIAVGLLLWSRPAPQASLDHRQLPDGSAASLANPGKQPNARVLLAVQADQKLDDAQLLALAHDSGARVVQFVFPENDCKAQQARIQAAGELLDGQPTLVAGIGPGSAWAFRWLAGQTDDKAKALSVGFSLEKPDCAATPLPQTAPHGHWLAAWNDNPDDASARFARGLKNAETVITDYDTPLPKVLADQLRQQLQGGGDNVPVVEVPAAKPSETVTLFYSGDGGWRDLDRDVAAQMAELGYPVVGVDALRYFWEHKTPEQSAADLALLMQHYREKWGAKHFVLAGYSFGATCCRRSTTACRRTQEGRQLGDPAGLRPQRQLRDRGAGLARQGRQEASTGPEMARLPGPKVLCVYGVEEKDESGCTQPQAVGENLQLPGGHHFDEDYPALAKRLVNAIRSRQSADDEG